MIPLSLLDALLPDEVMGARQAITENQTTGRFLATTISSRRSSYRRAAT